MNELPDYMHPDCMITNELNHTMWRSAALNSMGCSVVQVRNDNDGVPCMAPAFSLPDQLQSQLNATHIINT